MKFRKITSGMAICCQTGHEADLLLLHLTSLRSFANCRHHLAAMPRRPGYYIIRSFREYYFIEWADFCAPPQSHRISFLRFSDLLEAGEENQANGPEAPRLLEDEGKNSCIEVMQEGSGEEEKPLQKDACPQPIDITAPPTEDEASAGRKQEELKEGYSDFPGGFYNRSRDGLNPNACILGMPGTGKTCAAKREITNVLLNTDDNVYVIDTKREYKKLAEDFGGSTIRIASSSSAHINPFDLNLENTDDDWDPIKVKSDVIQEMIEIMVGGKYGLSPIEKSIIGRCVTNICEPYVQYLKRVGKPQDLKKAPTFKTFYDDLCSQPDMEAQSLALALERYVNGALEVFNHRTNVRFNNRFAIYDIKDIDPKIKEAGMLIILDNIWNHMVKNCEKKKKTWIYIEDFDVTMEKHALTNYISNFWKLARPWGGVPCAIIQNVEDMLRDPEARTIINNSQYITILGQSPANLEKLSKMMDISPSEQEYISSTKPGRGLVHIGNRNIPIDDNFLKDSKIYKSIA